MPEQPRILIVDDHPFNIELLEELLEDDYHVKTAVSGEEALSLAAHFVPDLILLDIMMPGMDGYETCRLIRATPTLCHTKIIMVSAKAMAEERAQGLEAGADDYITKPFEHSEFREKVRLSLQ
jgi:CheY-like chemotaxis protein